MKLDEFGVGRITAQNTTKDVKPGETERQAKKLGLMNGKPKLLHKTAAKNSDPNTLFNVGLSEDYKEISPEKMETWIRAYADRHGVDPDTAVKVWKSEGGMNYQSTVKKGNQQKYKGKEDSWGPFQLYRGGGLGNEWEKTYGKDLRSANDATSIQQQIDFALQNAAKSGWGQWYGAAKAGVKDYQGIPKKPLTTKYKPIDIVDGPTDSQIQKHIASKKPEPSLSDKITSKVSQAWDAAKPELKKTALDVAKRGGAKVLDIAKRGGEEVADVAKNISKGNINKDSWTYKNIVKPLTQDVNEEPASLYHATYKPFLDSIMKNGLGGSGAQTQWEDSKPGYVYLAKDYEVAVSHAEANEEVPDEYIDNIVVLVIDASKLDLEKLEDDPNVMDDDSTLAYNGIIPSTAFSVQLDELKIQKPDAKDTLGIKRKDMPQVKSKDYPKFLDYMRDNGVTFKKEIIPARDVKAMQDEFSDAGVIKQLKKNVELGPNTKPIILSSDNYIIDGHHRWLAAMNTGNDLNVFRVNMPAKQLYALVNKFDDVYYKDIYDETRGAISVPTSGGAINIFPHRPLKIKPSTPGKLRYEDIGSWIDNMLGHKEDDPVGDYLKMKKYLAQKAEERKRERQKRLAVPRPVAMEAVTQVDIDQLETFADKLFSKVGIDVEFTRHFLDRVNDPRNKKPITPAELTRLFKQEYKRWAKPIAQMGPGQEAVMKDLQTDINLPFALQYDRENNELDLIAKTVMRKKDFKTSNKEFAVEGYQLKLENDEDQLILHIKDTSTGERSEVRGKPNYEIDHDANDPLHKLLDQIGKSANISELMNGKTVSINPTHPSGPQSIDTVKDIMDENWEAVSGSLRNTFGNRSGTPGRAVKKSRKGATYQRGTGVYSQPNHYKPKKKQKPSMLKRAWDNVMGEAELEEGVNDPHIFKAVFLAGGPGSGKSFVAKNILGGTGLRSINSDEVYEFLMKKQGLSLDPETIFSPQGQEIRDKAKGLSRQRERTYLDGRLGLIIDGTGKDVSKYQVMAEKLKAIGYDVSMIYVNTSLEVAQQRNQQRERSLEPAKVEKMWNDVQQNLMKFQQIFGADRFHIIDNSGGLEDLDRQKNFDKVYNETQRFLNTPPKNRKAIAWIKQQKEQNDGKRSAQQSQQPSKQSDGGTTETN